MALINLVMGASLAPLRRSSVGAIEFNADLRSYSSILVSSNSELFFVSEYISVRALLNASCTITSELNFPLKCLHNSLERSPEIFFSDITLFVPFLVKAMTLLILT